MWQKLSIASWTLPPASILISLSLAAISCSWTPHVRTPLYEGPEGSVSLITESESTVHPSHPAELSLPTIDQILRGLHIQQHTGVLRGLFSGEPSRKPVFSDAQITWLTPILRKAFSQVTREEQVSIRVDNSPSTDLGIIKGTMFTDGSNLVVSLNWGTGGIPKSSKQSKGSGSRNPAGILKETLIFIPERAVRKNLDPSWLTGPDDSNRLVIDYTMIDGEGPLSEKSRVQFEKKDPMVGSESMTSNPAPGEPVSSGNPTETITPMPSNQPGNQNLLEEIKELKQKLEAQQAEIDALKNRERRQH